MIGLRGPAQGTKLLRFGLVILLGWSLLLSVATGTSAFLDLSGPLNVSLANHPAISEGRGSLWGDPSAKATWVADLAKACPGESSAAAKRCELLWARSSAAQTVLEDPSAALHRALLRVAETWAPDRFLPRHLEELRGAPQEGIRGTVVLLHGGLLLMALAGLRHTLGRRLVLLCLLWTLPVLLTIGFTRLRIPLTPCLLAAAALGLARGGSDPGRQAPERARGTRRRVRLLPELSPPPPDPEADRARRDQAACGPTRVREDAPGRLRPARGIGPASSYRSRIGSSVRLIRVA